MGGHKSKHEYELLYERFREAAPSFGFTDEFIQRQSDFEALFELFRDGPPLSVVDTLIRLAEVTNQVCEIRHNTTGRLGTGFLVGSDLVLTAFHVVSGQTMANLQCSFNNILFMGPQVVSAAPTTVSVVAQVDKSELALGAAVTSSAFDFSLLRVSAAVGDQSRKFIRIRPTRVDAGDSVYVVEFAESQAVTFAGGEVTVALNGANDAAFQHGARTASGASGAPVFNNQFEIVGLHRGAILNSTDNEAIDISRIFGQLRANGHL